jgi:hypothetical protein
MNDTDAICVDDAPDTKVTPGSASSSSSPAIVMVYVVELNGSSMINWSTSTLELATGLVQLDDGKKEREKSMNQNKKPFIDCNSEVMELNVPFN